MHVGIKIRCLNQLGEAPTNLVVIEGIDPSSSAYETATHPSTSYHLGVSNENRTHDSGITTRGFTTKLWTPYGNTLTNLVVGIEPTSSRSTSCIATYRLMCFHMVGAQRIEL